MSAMQEQPLPQRVMDWIAKCVSPQEQAQVVSARRLQGGISSQVYSVSVQVGMEIKHYVLRQFDNAEWLKEEPDLALHEAACLRRAAQADIPTPDIVAVDATGEQCGLPSVLMTLLEGAVVLQPDDMAHWLKGLAEALVRIHAVLGDDFAWEYFTYNDLNAWETPTWSTVPELWDRAAAMAEGPFPEHRSCFIHRDYHPANVLWANGAVSGVVDWVNACRGPAGMDLGHCRINLVMLYGVEEADAFLSAYEELAGDKYNYDPYWDLLSLMNMSSGPPKVYSGWTALGVTGLTDAMMAERMDRYVVSLMARVDAKGVR